MAHEKKTNKLFFILHLLICVVIFTLFSAFILIYHGPFIKLRDYIVSLSMTTNSNHMFATWFLSKQEIDEILSYTNATVKDGTENLDNVKISAPSLSDPDDQGIDIIDVSGKNFKGKLMVISDPSRISLGLAPRLGEVGASLSEIVKENNALGGINAGGFQDDNFTGTGAQPNGIVIQDGEIKFCQEDLRTYSVIGFTKENILFVSNSMTKEQIKDSNLRCAISFGPALIINGQPLVEQGGSTLQPRSAIAQRKDGTILILAIDGRSTESHGVNFKMLQDVLLQYGAYNAANLDGGSSTTMNYLGKTINTPCDITGERSIATAFLINKKN